MKPHQTVPLIAKLAPLAAAAPPLLFFAGIGLTLYWLLSDDKEKKTDTPADAEKSNAPKPALVSPRPTFTAAPIPLPVPKPASAPVQVAPVKAPLLQAMRFFPSLRGMV